ncbi:MAG: hypothetical protein Q8T13_00215 [Acidobacteriota bacterium]|nr:hypothetical protein [Acidobacteriota bacterium]
MSRFATAEQPKTPPRIVAAEPWLAIVVGVVWWAAMYPGLFGEDSLITLTEARDGPVTAWFTAWWVILIDLITMGTRAIPLLTLAGVVVLAWSTEQWAAATFPAGPARAWAVVFICATPLVGALGIQVRHDAWMTAGLLLCVAVLVRTGGRLDRFRAADYGQLALAMLLIPTRHNGLVTLILAAIGGLWVFGHSRMRYLAVLTTVALGVLGVTQAATRSAGLPHSVDPAQAVEWLMADVSCLLTQDGVVPTADEWATLETIASRTDWPQPRACNFVSPLFIAPTFRIAQVEPNIGRLIRTWLTLGLRYPVRMTLVHLRRVSLFLPPFIVGLQDQAYTPFIHSTILPNDFGLTWAFPSAANLARQPARAWNALRLVLANSAVWLVLIALAAWKLRGLRHQLLPTVVMAAALNMGLVATAPISEGRYGLFILICGQVTLVYWWLESRQARGVSRG